jgi:putative transposase
MESGWVVKLIKSAIEKYGKPRIINSDQGSQFTSEEYVKTIKEFEDIRISMDGKGRAIDNVWIERFFRTLKHEHVYLQPSNDGHDLHRSIKTFVHYYNSFVVRVGFTDGVFLFIKVPILQFNLNPY